MTTFRWYVYPAQQEGKWVLAYISIDEPTGKPLGLYYMAPEFPTERAARAYLRRSVCDYYDTRKIYYPKKSTLILTMLLQLKCGVGEI